jgi:hypothetical protein
MPELSYWVRVPTEDFTEAVIKLWASAYLSPLGRSVPDDDGKHWYILVKDGTPNVSEVYEGKVVEIAIGRSSIGALRRITSRTILSDDALG